MKISNAFKPGILEMTFSEDDVYHYLACHRRTRKELEKHFQKYATWMSDVKKIRTKEILQRANPR
jgi:hypothetical protein